MNREIARRRWHGKALFQRLIQIITYLLHKALPCFLGEALPLHFFRGLFGEDHRLGRMTARTFTPKRHENEA